MAVLYLVPVLGALKSVAAHEERAWFVVIDFTSQIFVNQATVALWTTQVVGQFPQVCQLMMWSGGSREEVSE